MNVANVTPITADPFTKSLTAGMLQLNGLQNVAMTAESAVSAGAFQQLLAQVIDQNIKADHEAEEKTTQFVTGQVSDIHDVMIAGEKADIAFQMTMAIRNKMVDAYTQVMGMQI
jgi:flagellar hook-basal body complex protein FliE